MQNIERNINYGTITAGGSVHIGDIVYVIERDFQSSILFLRIDAVSSGYKAMLSVKTSDDASLPLFRETVQLTTPDDLFRQVEEFQNLRRGAGRTMRRIDVAGRSPENWESTLTETLYQTFFRGDIGTVCHDFLDLLQMNKISELLLVVSTEDELIQNLPWEMILPKLTPGSGYHLPKNNFGLIRSRAKSVELFSRQGQTAQQAPLKMLFISAMPENLSEKDKLSEIEDEQRKIIEAVRSLESTEQPKLIMEILDCANLQEITDALDARSHDVVHISGNRAYVEEVKQGILYLENENGDQQETEGYQLGIALHHVESIKLLVLSACETAFGGPYGNIAEQMATVGFPAILAMRFSVTEVGTQLFTTKLYERLAYGDSLTKAVHDARLGLWQYAQRQRASTPQVSIQAEWFTPVLYQNQAIGPLVKSNEYNSTTLNRFYPKAEFLKGKHTRLIGKGFIGRKRLLIRLRQCFTQGKHVCIYGLGGLGKTTTAEAFAEHYRKQNGCDILIFRNAPEIHEAVILEQIFEKWKHTTEHNRFVVQQLKAQLDKPKNTPEAKLQLLIDNYLKDNRIIIIFDNFEDVQTKKNSTIQQEIVSKSLRSFINYLLQNVPRTCHILFTSRYRIVDVGERIVHMAIDKMTYAEQYRYINFSATLRKIPLAERSILDRRLDGHPRALGYLEELMVKDPNFDLARLDASVGVVEAKVFADLLLKHIFERLSEAERGVLILAATFFSRSPLAALCAFENRAVGELIPILAVLRDWSVCFWDETEQLFEVHALTRRWLILAGKGSSEKLHKGAAMINGSFFRDQSGESNLLLAKAYFEQGEYWEHYAVVVFELEAHYRLIGLYSAAMELNEQILTKNIDKKFYVSATNNIGLIYGLLGNNAMERKYMETALTLAESVSEITGDRGFESRILNNLATLEASHTEINLNDALEYLEKSKRIRMDNENYDDYENKFLQIFGYITYKQGDKTKALYYFEQSLDESRKRGNYQEECASLYAMGHIHEDGGEYSLASSYLEKCLKISQQFKFRHFESESYECLGQISNKQGDRPMALKYWEQSLKISEETGAVRRAGITLNNIAVVYEVEGNINRALVCHKRVLEIYKELKDRDKEANALVNIGGIYLKIGDFDNSLWYLEEGLKIGQEIGNRIIEGEAKFNLSILVNARGDYRKALEYLEQSLEISLEIDDMPKVVVSLMCLGSIYFERFQDIEKAMFFFCQAKPIFEKIELPDKDYSPLNGLANIYAQIGEERFYQIFNSIHNIPKS